MNYRETYVFSSYELHCFFLPLVRECCHYFKLQESILAPIPSIFVHTKSSPSLEHTQEMHAFNQKVLLFLVSIEKQFRNMLGDSDGLSETKQKVLRYSIEMVEVYKEALLK